MTSAAWPARQSQLARGQLARSLAGLTAALMLGACSQSASLLPSVDFLADSEPAPSSQQASADSGTELQKATIYWGQQYSKKPSDVQNALNYARNLKALGEKQKALLVLQEASTIHNGNSELAGEYGRLALELDQVNVADKLLALADNPTKPDWRIISARGTVLSKQGNYKQAIGYYERALTLSNNQPSVLNNLAMAHVMNGEPAKAEELLRQAAAETGAPPKISQNLALVLGLQGRYDEAKSYAVTSAGAEAIKSDADLLRTLVKAPARAAPMPAIPAFKTEIAAPTASAKLIQAKAPVQPSMPPVTQQPPIAMRPPVIDTTSSATAAAASAKTADSSGVGLKGSSR